MVVSINLIILVLYSSLLPKGPYHELNIGFLNIVHIGISLLLAIVLGIKRPESNLALAFLLSALAIGLVGFSICIGNININ